MTTELIPTIFFASLLSTTLVQATSVLFPAIGDLFAERSGVLNIGIEGIMLLSAATGFIAVLFTGELLLGVTVGILTGFILGILVGVFEVTLRVNQIVFGLGLFLLGPSGSAFLVQPLLTQQGGHVILPTFEPLTIPGLTSLPVVGSILRQNLLVYVAFAATIACSLILLRTNFGLKLRVVGEDPHVADSLGIKVYRLRYLAVIISSLFASLGGLFMIFGQTGVWINNVTAGRGFIAIALVRVGGWKPQWVILASLLFGIIDALQFQFQVITTILPHQFLQMQPYIAGIVVLILASRWRALSAPKSLGVPYVRGSG